MVSDHLHEGGGFSTNRDELSVFLGDQLHEGFNLALSSSFNWSAEFWWWWNECTSQDLVDVVNWSSARSQFGDSSDNVSCLNQLSVDSSNEGGSSVDLVCQLDDDGSDLVCLDLQDVLFVDQWLDALNNHWNLGWPWWLDNENSWWFLSRVDMVDGLSDDSLNVVNLVFHDSDVSSDLGDLGDDDWFLLLRSIRKGVMNQNVQMVSEDLQLLGEFDNVMDVLSHNDGQLSDLLPVLWFVDARQ